MSQVTESATIAADYIRTIDSKLASAFLARPFHRVALAEMDRDERLAANS